MVKIRKYENGDEAGIMDLDRSVELHPWNRRDIKNWNWKYKGSNPAGKPLIYIAEDKGEIIGHFAAIPINYFISGKLVKGSHSIAMIIDPKWQNKGLIKFIADQLFKNIEEEKIPFTYGYPNDNAYILHKEQFSYIDIGQQDFYYKKLEKNIKIEKEKNLTGLTFKEIARFDKSVDELCQETKNDYKVIVKRDSQFLNWRYSDRPDIHYYKFGGFGEDKLLGYCILKLYKEDKILRGHFIDIFSKKNNNDCLKLLITKALNFFQSKNADEVNLWIQGSKFVQTYLLNNGFSINDARPLICRFNECGQNFRDCLVKDEWYFVMGDTLEIY